MSIPPIIFVANYIERIEAFAKVLSTKSNIITKISPAKVLYRAILVLLLDELNPYLSNAYPIAISYLSHHAKLITILCPFHAYPISIPMHIPYLSHAYFMHIPCPFHACLMSIPMPIWSAFAGCFLKLLQMVWDTVKDLVNQEMAVCGCTTSWH